jgi:hypothetical protein
LLNLHLTNEWYKKDRKKKCLKIKDRNKKTETKNLKGKCRKVRRCRHPNIWSFIKCVKGDDARFRHMILQMNASAKDQPKKEISDAIQQRIDILNKRFINNEINLTKLLGGLSLVVGKDKR